MELLIGLNFREKRIIFCCLSCCGEGKDNNMAGKSGDQYLVKDMYFSYMDVKKSIMIF